MSCCNSSDVAIMLALVSEHPFVAECTGCRQLPNRAGVHRGREYAAEGRQPFHDIRAFDGSKPEGQSAGRGGPGGKRTERTDDDPLVERRGF